jgi:hypothetical protein
MITSRLATGLGAIAALTSTLWATSARADIPTGYKGTPFMGTPWPIPGRIDFENYDEGGMGIGWRVDDHTGNFGVGGCPGNDYRTALPHPQLCKTNTNPGEIDLYSAGPMKGLHYPSDAMPQSIYIGYTHGADWVKITVNVAKAGMYKLSSVWGSEPGGAAGIHFQILFNDVMKADVTLPGTGGYHNWVDFPDFATVQLDAGVQVFQFAPKNNHLNYDYLQFSLVTPTGVDPGSTGGTSGTAGSAGTAGTTGTAGATGGAGSGGATGTAGATGAAGATGTAGTTGAAGDPGAAGAGTTGGAGGDATGAAGTTGTSTGGTTGSGAAGTTVTGGGAGAGGARRASSSGGCAYAATASDRAGGPGASLLLAGLFALSRRTRRRR